jgi:hypothetical protein
MRQIAGATYNQTRPQLLKFNRLNPNAENNRRLLQARLRQQYEPSQRARCQAPNLSAEVEKHNPTTFSTLAPLNVHA